MTRSGSDQTVVPSDIPRLPVAVTDERVVTGGQVGSAMRPTPVDWPAICLESLARNLQVLAQQIDRLSKIDHLDAGQFMQLDTAARYAVAATHAIKAADGTTDPCSEQRDAAGLGEPNLGQIQAELAEKLIRRIFTAGLHLTALQSLLGEVLGHKAAAIVEELDAVIRDIRAGVWE